MSDNFVEKYKQIGEQKFYNFLLTYALNRLVITNSKGHKSTSPELELLEYCDKFLVSYRRSGDETYLEISKVFRKAAHKIYRIMIKKNMTSKNLKFMNLV